MSEKEERTYTQREVDVLIAEHLTIQLLRLRNEVFRGGGMGKKEFTQTYLRNIGPYERRLAKREEIEL